MVQPDRKGEIAQIFLEAGQPLEIRLNRNYIRQWAEIKVKLV